MNRLFNLDVPIIQAPMGGVSTPELVACVSNAGALGSLGAGYMAPEEIRRAIRQIKALTDKPFNVNLFIPETTQSAYDLKWIKGFLEPLWQELSSEPFEIPPLNFPTFDEQVEVILEERVPVFSFTFGLLSPILVQSFQSRNTLLIGTATTPEEAELLETAGVDAIVCQGVEAGGHRGHFSSDDPLYELFELLLITRQRVKTPLIAAGGIMNGRSVAAALHVGARAAQLGTAFLTTTESGIHPVYKQALLQQPHFTTVLTKAFTGKWARMITNAFIEKLGDLPTLPYPIQHLMTQPLRLLAAKKHRPDLMSLFAGKGYPLCRCLSAAQLVDEIKQDLLK